MHYCPWYDICVWRSKEGPYWRQTLALLVNPPPYRFIFPCVYILLCLVDLFLFQLENNLEEVSHGNDHLPGGLLRLDPEETVAILGTAVDVTKCTVVRHVLGNEADLVHRVVVQAILKPGSVKFQKEFVSHFSLDLIKSKIITGERISHPCLFISYLEAVNSNLNVDLASQTNNEIELCFGIPPSVCVLLTPWWPFSALEVHPVKFHLPEWNADLTDKWT